MSNKATTFLQKAKKFFSDVFRVGTWDSLLKAGTFFFICMFATSLLVGLFINLILGDALNFTVFASWNDMNYTARTIVLTVFFGMLIYSVIVTLVLTVIFDRVVFRPVNSILSEVKKRTKAASTIPLSMQQTISSDDPFRHMDTSGSWMDSIRQYVSVASSEKYYDETTGCFNRKYFTQELSEILRTQVMCDLSRGSGPKTIGTPCYCIYMIDIDHFKRINDDFGHLYGDQVLRDVGASLRNTVGDSGVIIRNGGEEFVAVVCHKYPANFADYAEQLRNNLAESVIVSGERAKDARSVTCSIGFVPFPFFEEIQTTMSLQAHVDLADQAMYLAKTSGRNTWRGLDPIACPRTDEEIEKLSNSIDYGAEVGYIHIIKPQ